MDYKKAKRIDLKSHPDYQERWVQEKIADDPAILGLGDLVLRDKERIQPRAGRLDLLLQDLESNRRYEVEIQLGPTDETHIIRTIEYWDIERKRYPQYDHCGVLIAEDITSRFLNVISLFNGTIPLIALQMQAIEVGEYMTLIFTKVLDEMTLGYEDDEMEPSDRKYWENKVGTKKTVGMVDTALKLVHELDSTLELKYNKMYIGLSKDGRPFNFVTFMPRKVGMIVTLRLDKSNQIDKLIEDSGFNTLKYTGREYQIKLSESNLKEHNSRLNELISKAFESWKR